MPFGSFANILNNFRIFVKILRIMTRKVKQYSEAELIGMFGLERINEYYTPLMEEWLDCTTTLASDEQVLFDRIHKRAKKKIDGWQEEELKMKFIAFILELALLDDSDLYSTYLETTIEATVEGHFLKLKTDFMVAKGILDLPEMPYFHFQEWKKHRDPNGDPVGQLLEAFLIAQEKNGHKKPLYGCTITGKYWEFFVMENKAYCISKSYDSTEKDQLLQIVAILRKFKEILEMRLLD
jgi:hypothetical protein